MLVKVTVSQFILSLVNFVAAIVEERYYFLGYFVEIVSQWSYIG